MKNKKTIVYYVSAHGYGHGVRSADVIRALKAGAPEVRVLLVTELPDEFVGLRFPLEATDCRRAAFDVGMIQHDAITVDVEQTRIAMERLHQKRSCLIEQEVAFLREVRASLVVVDIPSIPLEAAARSGIDSVAVGNFGWNWIYEPFMRDDARWRPLIEAIEEGYRSARMLYRLPFAEPMQVFEERCDVPLLARPGQARRDWLARRTGADPAKEWGLLSFTALHWGAEAVDRATRCGQIELFTVHPLCFAGSRLRAVHPQEIAYSDVLASMDWVLSKPGYGLVSECVVNNKPLIYVDRDHFAEYPVLVAAIKRYLRCAHIAQADLYAGQLEGAIRSLHQAAPPEAVLPGGGDLELAGLLLRRLLDERSMPRNVNGG